MKCKESGNLFGLEVKKDEHLTGTNLGEYLLQAFFYSKMEFKTIFLPESIKILIFIAPAISNVLREIIPESRKKDGNKEYFELFHKYDMTVNNTNSFIGCFNVGEIRKAKNRSGEYYYFMYKNQIVWDSNYGIRLHNYNKAYNIMLKNNI